MAGSSSPSTPSFGVEKEHLTETITDENDKPSDSPKSEAAFEADNAEDLSAADLRSSRQLSNASNGSNSSADEELDVIAPTTPDADIVGSCHHLSAVHGLHEGIAGHQSLSEPNLDEAECNVSLDGSLCDLPRAPNSSPEDFGDKVSAGGNKFEGESNQNLSDQLAENYQLNAMANVESSSEVTNESNVHAGKTDEENCHELASSVIPGKCEDGNGEHSVEGMHSNIPEDELGNFNNGNFETKKECDSFMTFAPTYPNKEGFFRTSLDKHFWTVEKKWRMKNHEHNGRQVAPFEHQFPLNTKVLDVFGDEVLDVALPKVRQMLAHPDIPFKIAEENIVTNLTNPFATIQFIVRAHQVLEKLLDTMGLKENFKDYRRLAVLNWKADSLKRRSMNLLAIFPLPFVPDYPRWACWRCQRTSGEELCRHDMDQRIVLRNRVNDHIEDISRRLTLLSRDVEKAMVSAKVRRVTFARCTKRMDECDDDDDGWIGRIFQLIFHLIVRWVSFLGSFVPLDFAGREREGVEEEVEQ